MECFDFSVFSRLNAPGVYFKIGSFDPAFQYFKPAFNRGRAFINEVQFSVIFSG